MSSLEKRIRALKERKSRQGELNRQAGYRFENKVYGFLKRNYKLVINSSGSRGIADLRAWKADGTEIIVSCKTNGYWTEKELKELRELKEWKTKFGRREIKLASYVSKKKWTMRTFK
jgi:hypothetical protein